MSEEYKYLGLFDNYSLVVNVCLIKLYVLYVYINYWCTELVLPPSSQTMHKKPTHGSITELIINQFVQHY